MRTVVLTVSTSVSRREAEDASGPLLAHLADDRGHDLAITVANGRVLVQNTADDDDFPQPVRGVAAHLDADGLVLALPFALSGTVDATLGIELDDVSYGDNARVKSA